MNYAIVRFTVSRALAGSLIPAFLVGLWLDPNRQLTLSSDIDFTDVDNVAQSLSQQRQTVPSHVLRSKSDTWPRLHDADTAYY